MRSVWDDFSESQILLEIGDNFGLNPLIFPDPEGGIVVTQTINWDAMIDAVVGPVGRNLLFDQHSPTGEQLHRAGNDPLHTVCWRRCWTTAQRF